MAFVECANYFHFSQKLRKPVHNNQAIYRNILQSPYMTTPQYLNRDFMGNLLYNSNINQTTICITTIQKDDNG